jgi:hypothetical protein
MPLPIIRDGVIPIAKRRLLVEVIVFRTCHWEKHLTYSSDGATDVAKGYLAENLGPLFWPSPRADQISAWHGHVSFAHWLITEAKPGVVVELGSHNGVSYAAFCNAVKKSHLPTKCFAIDTWKGDEHAGVYDESVYQNLKTFNDANFPEFSSLLRSFFEEAIPLFDDHSIDLLHIDGLHTYAAVKSDFQGWLTKLSDRAIVLFHDTVIRKDDFGVWELWEQLTKLYPSFSFGHSSGLGVLAVGKDQSKAVTDLCSNNQSVAGEIIRTNFTLASNNARRAGEHDLNVAKEKRFAALNFQGKNIALNCVAFQSSGYPGCGSTPQAAVNGIKTGKAAFHTQTEENAWWMVDLGAVRSFDEIVIYNRLDSNCAGRAKNIVVLLSADGERWDQLYSHDGTIFGGVDGYPLRIQKARSTARFVRIKNPEKQFLHLDEIEIYDRE